MSLDCNYQFKLLCFQMYTVVYGREDMLTCGLILMLTPPQILQLMQ